MILDRFRLDDKVALVTGAGRGIGEGCALAFADVGANVVCSARTPEQIEETAEQVRKRGPKALVVPCDVMQQDQLENLVARTLDEFGRIDVLVNNAGGSPPKPMLETSERYFDQAYHFNVTTAFALSKLVIPHMQKGGGGSIVNISSAAGRLVQKNMTAYGAAKCALSFLTKNMGAEFAPDVRVNAIAVGTVATSALLPYLNDELRKTMEDNTPLARLGEPEDIALMALYLASPAASWITGKVYEVDGGTESTTWPF